MIGDKIIAKPHHKRAAKAIYEFLKDKIQDCRTAITIAGESGSGKSEIALELSRLLESHGLPTITFQQDDYFFYPPKTNHEMRLKNIEHVGLQEVNLSLLNDHIQVFKTSKEKLIEKPLVIFDEDRISIEKIDLVNYSVLIAEGTYTTCLNSVDYHVFIDRTYIDTQDSRLERARNKIDDYSEKILEIEHAIISKHKKLATIIVNKEYNVSFAEPS